MIVKARLKAVADITPAICCAAQAAELSRHTGEVIELDNTVSRHSRIECSFCGAEMNAVQFGAEGFTWGVVHFYDISEGEAS